MNPVLTYITVTLALLHLVLVARLLYKRYPQQVTNTVKEPTLLQIVICTVAILLLSVGVKQWLARLAVIVTATWLMKIIEKKRT